MAWFRASRCLVLVPLLLGACGGSDKAACPERFDTQAWERASVGSDQRRKLALQVERCGFADDSSKPRVRELLGSAERLEGQYPVEFKREWYYYVGETNGSMGPADSQYLVITFDKSGRVIRAALEPQ
jgi:hypothetical protein